MILRLEDRLPFVTVTLGHGGREVLLERVLLDTDFFVQAGVVLDLGKLEVYPSA